MKYFEFGQGNPELMVMLPGGGVCYRGAIHIAEKIVCKMMGRTEESLERILYRDATWRSWANQDRCMIGRHKDFELFKRTDLYIWHGIRSSTEKKLAKHIREWQDKGYAFTYKVFPNMGHGTLAGEHPALFSKEVQAAHRCRLEKIEGIGQTTTLFTQTESGEEANR